MKYTIYKTTNDLNGKYYIGKHQTNNINDSYLGSGVLLNKDIEKYGKEHFHKEILFIFDNEIEMNEKEKELITEEVLSDSQCYNLAYGGDGGDTWSHTGRKHTELTKQKISETIKEKLKDPKFKEKTSIALKKAIEKMKKENPEHYAEVAKRRGKTLSEHLQLKKEQGQEKCLSDKTRMKISAGMTKYYDTIGRKNPRRIKREIKSSIPISGKKTAVTNGTKEIRIYIEELDWYLANGWKQGKKPSTKRPNEEAILRSSGKGKIVIHNKTTQQVKRILPDELENYLKTGWKHGYLNTKKKKQV